MGRPPDCGAGLWTAYGSTQDGHYATVGGDGCNTNGLGATEWVAGYTYNVNKYLDLYAVFYDIREGQGILNRRGPG